MDSNPGAVSWYINSFRLYEDVCLLPYVTSVTADLAAVYGNPSTLANGVINRVTDSCVEFGTENAHVTIEYDKPYTHNKVVVIPDDNGGNKFYEAMVYVCNDPDPRNCYKLSCGGANSWNSYEVDCYGKVGKYLHVRVTGDPFLPANAKVCGILPMAKPCVFNGINYSSTTFDLTYYYGVGSGVMIIEIPPLWTNCHKDVLYAIDGGSNACNNAVSLVQDPVDFTWHIEVLTNMNNMKGAVCTYAFTYFLSDGYSTWPATFDISYGNNCNSATISFAGPMTTSITGLAGSVLTTTWYSDPNVFTENISATYT